MTCKRLTAQRGEDCIISKLDNQKVREIRETVEKRDILKAELKAYPIKARKTAEYLQKRFLAQTMSNKAMAKRYGVSVQAIIAVNTYITWSHI